MNRPGIACFVSARNLGDAVLHADFLNKLQRSSYARRWIIWTFPQAAFLFEAVPDSQIVCSDFPMGATARSFFKGGYRSFVKGVRLIRSLRPEVTLDVVGDLRERFALRLLGAGTRLSAEWEDGHPFRRHNRMLPYRPGQLLSIPASETSLYAAQRRMLRALAPNELDEREQFSPVRFVVGEALHIGLHPFASATFKLWPESHWVTLVEILSERFPESKFTLYGASSDQAVLDRLSPMIKAPHELATGSLREFRDRISDLDLLIGLDSFSVHLAHSRNVPSVVLVGANDARVFTPPSARAVVHPGVCEFQPCGGRTKCVGTAFQYACMNSITPMDVLSAVPIAPPTGSHRIYPSAPSATWASSLPGSDPIE